MECSWLDSQESGGLFQRNKRQLSPIILCERKPLYKISEFKSSEEFTEYMVDADIKILSLARFCLKWKHKKLN